MKLLIVDDSSVVRQAILTYLEGDDIEIVGEAENGKVAIDMFDKHRPDLVTMDITMPEMNGLDCIDKMIRIRNDTKIIVISALGDKETALTALKKGASEFLLKPFEAEQLRRCVMRLKS